MNQGLLVFRSGVWAPGDPFDRAASLSESVAERSELLRVRELAEAGRLTRVTPAEGEVAYTVRRPAQIRAIDAETRRVTVVMSDATVDRYGDTIAPEGWQTQHFEKNPVSLLDHDYRVAAIAGQVMRTWVEAGQFLGLVQVDDPSSTQAAAEVWPRIVSRSLRAVSVGFRALKWAKRFTEEGEWAGGFDYLEQELYELSWVAVPANPSAVIPASVDLEDSPASAAQSATLAMLVGMEQRSRMAAITSRLMGAR